MVVFTCNSCGECLQKPKVEKHFFICKSKKSLTCSDCFKDFRDDEYLTHTKCITEEERYGPKGAYTNGIQKKGEVKQESWIEMIRAIQEKETSLKPSCRNLLNTICSYSNIPRKKQKFINFIKSCFGGRVNIKDIEDVWNLIEKHKSSTSINNKSDKTSIEMQKNKNGEVKELKNEENNTKKRKSSLDDGVVPEKKTKHSIIIDENAMQTNVADENKKFSFQEKILEILNSRGSISLRKLEKKVLNAYLKETGNSEITQKITKKFNKKLKKLSNIEISDDKVTLLENI